MFLPVYSLKFAYQPFSKFMLEIVRCFILISRRTHTMWIHTRPATVKSESIGDDGRGCNCKKMTDWFTLWKCVLNRGFWWTPAFLVGPT